MKWGVMLKNVEWSCKITSICYWLCTVNYVSPQIQWKTTRLTYLWGFRLIFIGFPFVFLLNFHLSLLKFRWNSGTIYCICGYIVVVRSASCDPSCMLGYGKSCLQYRAPIEASNLQISGAQKEHIKIAV